MEQKIILILSQNNVFEGKYFYRVWIDPKTYCVKNVVRNLVKYGRVTSPKLIVLPVGDKWLIQSEKSIKKRGLLKNHSQKNKKNKFLSSNEEKKIISIDINSSQKVDKNLFLQNSSVELFFPAEINYKEAIDILLDKLK